MDFDQESGVVEEGHSNFADNVEDDDFEGQRAGHNQWAYLFRDEVCSTASIRWHDFRR